jgi:hypothetical protein
MVPDVDLVTDYDAVNVYGLTLVDLKWLRCVRKKHIQGIRREGMNEVSALLRVPKCSAYLRYRTGATQSLSPTTEVNQGSGCEFSLG